LRTLVQDRARALLDAIAEAGETEFIRAFASDLPLWTMCRFLGIDEGDRMEIAGFLTGTEEGFSQQMTPELRRKVEASILALNDYVARLIDRRSRDPKDDIVSALVMLRNTAGGPADDEMLAMVVNIIGGSVGSTRAAFANTALLFAEHPEQAAIVRARPDLARQAVEECLRLHPPFRIARRQAVAPIRAFGLDLAPGDTVFVPKQAVNRDPARWDRPNAFDVMRPERRHLSFGYGAHFCLGQAIARANLQEAVPIILDRLHDIELIRQPKREPFTMDEQLDGLWLRFRPSPAGGTIH
jgi:cytochrome P450